MRTRLTTLAAAAAVAVGLAALPTAASARTCSGGYTHGVINGAEKCLHAGEYCTASAARQYIRYGFHCVPYGGGTRRLR